MVFPSINTVTISNNQGGRSNAHSGASRGRGRGKNRTPRCQICWQFGHRGADCSERFNRAFPGGAAVRPRGPQQSQQQPLHLPASAFTGAYEYPAAFSAHVPHAMASAPASPSSSAWYPDSGATHHITPDYNMLLNPSVYNGPDKVYVGNGEGLHISTLGLAILPNPSRPLHLNHVLHVPTITRNLLSVRQLTTDNNVFVEFDPTSCFVKDRISGKVLLRGQLKDGLYHFSPTQPSHALLGEHASPPAWHARLGHPNLRVLSQILNKDGLPTTHQSSSFVCEYCMISKNHKLPFIRSSSTSSKRLQLLYSDLWDPAPTLSHASFSYYVIFIDD